MAGGRAGVKVEFTRGTVAFWATVVASRALTTPSNEKYMASDDTDPRRSGLVAPSYIQIYKAAYC
jgi:hypothetical protein